MTFSRKGESDNHVLKDFVPAQNLTVLEELPTPQFSTISPEERDRIDREINLMRSPELKNRDAAAWRILNEASKSEPVRAYTIDELIQNVRSFRNYDDVLSSHENGFFWEGSVKLLGELAAEKALPLLVERMNWGYRWSDSLSGFAAFSSVVKIGKPAVPRLSETLLSGSDYLRPFAAQALVLIEGHDAKTKLQAALANEEIGRNREFIERLLAGLE